eukprot:g839.t1
MNKLTGLLAFGLTISAHATAAPNPEPCPEGSVLACPDGSLFVARGGGTHCGGELATCVPIAMHQSLDAAAPAHFPEFDQASVAFSDQEEGVEENGSEGGDEDKYDDDDLDLEEEDTLDEDDDDLDSEEEDALDEGDDDLDDDDLDDDQGDLDEDDLDQGDLDDN